AIEARGAWPKSAMRDVGARPARGVARSRSGVPHRRRPGGLARHHEGLAPRGLGGGPDGFAIHASGLEARRRMPYLCLCVRMRSWRGERSREARSSRRPFPTREAGREGSASTMYVPKQLFFTKGVGTHREKLTSFELALRDAQIACYNLVRVSSI